MHESADANIISSSQIPDSGGWLLFPEPRPDAEVLLVCFPYAGGSAHTFMSWARKIDRRIEVAAAHLPGARPHLQERSAPGMADIVRRVAISLCEVPQRPLVLFGHSLGALLAFEVSRWLAAHAATAPRHLVVSGRAAAPLPHIDTPAHLLDDPGLIAKLRQLNGTPRTILDSPETIGFFLPRLRMDLRLDDSYVYRPGPMLTCPVTAMGGTEDPDASYERLLAWRQVSGAGFNLRMFPGDHFYLHSAETSVLRALETIALAAHGA
jgi:medium-chain acyl-[acyl-carrier-protein] hydrolase